MTAREWLSLAVRLGVVAALAAALVHGWRSGNTLVAVVAAVNLVGLSAVMLSSPVMQLCEMLLRSAKGMALRPEEGRWREFRSVPVAVRLMDGVFFVRESDARKICGDEWPQQPPATVQFPGEKGSFLRARLLAAELERGKPMPSMRVMGFVRWLNTLQ
ncbi:hypothetical protein [Roseateles depolymerans]|uniref:Uncharacterized protein n=1 Tax=Roseateles depolymerans TaxID=76731 RepID=A0A0U3MSB5_9BURK|nr:hypothetical protein [Roseateles depolymerans]ALV05859.1 hypothetical protein RD2015_1369 [Roseateles depolymerans]REG12868.1 hypothetical protein DES44_4240 [Roseateles depolymerans]